MAFTVTRFKQNFGNKLAYGMKIVADAATQNVESGLDVIEWYNLGAGSMATRAISVGINSGTSGTANAGNIGVTGVASGDEFYLTVYGR